jgi:hypothetical protein
MEQTEKVEGVHKANGTNGKRSGGCILYQTRALLHQKTRRKYMKSAGFTLLIIRKYRTFTALTFYGFVQHRVNDVRSPLQVGSAVPFGIIALDNTVVCS